MKKLKNKIKKMSMNLRQAKKPISILKLNKIFNILASNSFSKRNQSQKDSKDDDKNSVSNENLSEIQSNQISNSSIDNDGRGRLNKRNNVIFIFII